MKKSNRFYLFISLFSTLFGMTACGPGGPGVPGSIYGLSEDFSHEGNRFTIQCGTNKSLIHYRITELRVSSVTNDSLFAILLNGSPGTFFVGDSIILANLFRQQSGLSEATIDPYGAIVKGLAERGYRVIELSYSSTSEMETPNAEGFYSVCYRQGLPNVVAHNAKLYDEAIRRLGYKPDRDNHRLVGFGISLGALQLETMAFMSGKKFEKVALSGVLLGDPVAGCKATEGLNPTYNDRDWIDFVHLADLLTTSGRGCSSPTQREYNSNYNFRYFQHSNRWDLAMFEGNRQQSLIDFSEDRIAQALRLSASPWQAQQLVSVRNSTAGNTGGQTRRAADPAATQLNSYSGCGHEVLYCSQGRATQDILQYLDPSRKGLDVGP